MEEIDAGDLLDIFALHRFELGERVILGHLGTVQTLLGLIFAAPVSVRVIECHREAAQVTPAPSETMVEERLTRKVELVAGGKVACNASSLIPLGSSNRPDFIRDVEAGEAGLGQLIVKHRIPATRLLHSVGRDPEGFWRHYSITGPGLNLEIREFFPRQPFVEAGWLPGQRRPGL